MTEQNQVMKMERDMDLIRLMLIAHVNGEKPPELEQYDSREIRYHYTLLKDAGFITATLAEGNDVVPDEVMYVRVTWLGHEFCDASKDSNIWKMAKEHVLKPGASFTVTALLEWLKHEVRKQLLGG